MSARFSRRSRLFHQKSAVLTRPVDPARDESDKTFRTAGERSLYRHLSVPTMRQREMFDGSASAVKLIWLDLDHCLIAPTESFFDRHVFFLFNSFFGRHSEIGFW